MRKCLNLRTILQVLNIQPMNRILLFSVLMMTIGACQVTVKKPEIKVDTLSPDTLQQSPPLSTRPKEIVEPVAQPLDLNSLPAGIRFKGKAVAAVSWSDANGENILVQSSTGRIRDGAASKKMQGEMDMVELYANVYVKNGENWELLWTLIDFVRECELDIEASFLKPSPMITDLDHDGLAEATVAYKLACRSDVSPADMKIIMHEGKEKFGLRGMMITDYEIKFNQIKREANSLNLAEIKRSKDEMEAYKQAVGRYQNETDFAKAPPEFLAFAKRKWYELMYEKITGY